MHSDCWFIYIPYHYSTALCIQMSLSVFHSLLHLSILQIQLISLMPPGLNQYAWLKVSVINTWVLFQATLSFPCSWFVPERCRLRMGAGESVHVEGNQQTFTLPVRVTEKLVPEAQRARCTFVTNECYRTWGQLWHTLVINGEGVTLEDISLPRPVVGEVPESLSNNTDIIPLVKVKVRCSFAQGKQYVIVSEYYVNYRHIQRQKKLKLCSKLLIRLSMSHLMESKVFTARGPLYWKSSLCFNTRLDASLVTHSTLNCFAPLAVLKTSSPLNFIKWCKTGLDK